MHFIEKSIRKQGAVPISLGMIDGDVNIVEYVLTTSWFWD